MSILNNVKRGAQVRPQRVGIYGVEGVGKTTLASQLPSPIFLDTEDGTTHLDVSRLEIGCYDELQSAVQALLVDRHEFKSVVVDTIDWAEQLLIAETVRRANNPKIRSIEDFGYGKGYVALAELMAEFLRELNGLVAKGMHVVLLAHSQKVKFELPDQLGAFDKYELKLHKKTAPLVKEWADALLFCNFVTVVMDGKATGGSQRRIHTQPSAPFEAKNRHGLPDVVEMNVEALDPIFGAVGDSPASAPVNSPNVSGNGLEAMFGGVVGVREYLAEKGILGRDATWSDVTPSWTERLLNDPEKVKATVAEFMKGKGGAE